MKIVVSGGTGFIGRVLLRRLKEENHQVVLLTRDPDVAKSLASDNILLAPWDGKTVGAWADHMEGADAVVNLAGEPVVGKRWTSAQKSRILNSRVDAAKAFVFAVGQSRKKPSVLVNASAVGYYGHVEDKEVTESHPRGKGFLSDTCELWEEAARAAERFGVRVVCLRIGIVLEKDGGALQKMIPPFQFFMGGPLGSGRQWVPWIHRDDLVGAILFALVHQELSGPVNATSPHPVTMKAFCETLGEALHRPSWAPAPSFALRLLLGEMSEVLLTGQKAIPKKLEGAGYSFRYPELHTALHTILR